MNVREWTKYLTGNEVTKELVEYLDQNFEDFSDVRRKYITAIEQLENEAEENALLPVHTLVEAIKQQTASTLLFSAALGVRANLDHFLNPMARTILDIDFDVFLRENTAHQLPECKKAQMLISSFLKSLSSEHTETGQAIIEYISYVETTGPKLAHYFGFAIADTVLHRVVPGYYPDYVLTRQYEAMVKRYLGIGTL